MSRYCSVETEFNDLNALVCALQEMGWTMDQIEVHDSAQHLFGFQGDQRTEMAHVIVRRNNVGRASNDLGFFKKSDGSYSAIISAFDQSRYGDRWISKLKGEYAFHKVRTQAKQSGRTVRRERFDNGRQRFYVEGYR